LNLTAFHHPSISLCSSLFIQHQSCVAYYNND